MGGRVLGVGIVGGGVQENGVDHGLRIFVGVGRESSDRAKAVVRFVDREVVVPGIDLGDLSSGIDDFQAPQRIEECVIGIVHRRLYGGDIR